ncbi:DUF928 domain-containing protein [Trichothermofontia sichuanensis B231]|uniref:DUF928 domain-containing protein n=1 Tax=Trichothermofontia sichuanensis TaxID=3045816 RepID=UPI0022454016|nr:DUF928 domain-containing protein [Trichothermofontia sichuanensis]UZQ53833.1 DUF928 domain-containing protein [Trichothermofontia sichuanensis B231]
MCTQHTYRQLVLAGLGAALLTIAIGLPAYARKLPGRRVVAGTRGECLIAQAGQQASLPLLTLVPASHLSLTTRPYPEFFWFNPQLLGQTVVFQLHAVDHNLNTQRLLYEKPVMIGNRVGIHSLQLPNDGSVPPLQVGQLYRWSVTPQCYNEAERNLVWRVMGWVEPIAAPGTAESGTLEQQALAAAQADRWLDAFSLLKQATCEALPSRQSAVTDSWWHHLDQLDLEQTQIDLPRFKQQAIANLNLLCE